MNSSNESTEKSGAAINTSFFQNCLFLKNHALFLVSEQAKEEEILETGGSSDKIICSPIINQQLSEIESELEEFYKTKSLDALNCYLLGLIYKERNKK